MPSLLPPSREAILHELQECEACGAQDAEIERDYWVTFTCRECGHVWELSADEVRRQLEGAI